VDIATKVVTVSCDPSCSASSLVAAVSTAGFEASVAGSSAADSPPLRKAGLLPTQDVKLSVPGMRCMKNCGSKVQAALRSVPGVAGA
jgi:copper chaperone CopZ